MTSSPTAEALADALGLRQGDTARLTKEAHIYSALRTAILSGQIMPGAHLRVGELAEAFGVSAIPVRAAFRMLEADKLVEVTPHIGTFVTEIPVQEVIDAVEVRAVLEAEAMAAAVEKVTGELMAELRMYCAEMDALAAGNDPASYAAVNKEFHRAMYQRSDNKVLIETLHLLEFKCERGSVSFLAEDHQRMKRSNTEHRALVQALEQGDLPLLQQLVRLHRRNSSAAVQQVLQPRKSRRAP